MDTSRPDPVPEDLDGRDHEHRKREKGRFVTLPFDRSSPVAQLHRAPSIMHMDAVRRDDGICLYLDVPGVEPYEILVTVVDDSLTIDVTRAAAEPDVSGLIRERARGSFRREITMTDALDLTATAAKLEDGVLTVEVPLRDPSARRSVAITCHRGTVQVD